MSDRRGGFPWPILGAVLAALVLAAVAAWYLFSELVPPRAVVPGWAGAPFQPLSARLPEIAGWESFYVNDDNPFLPWREREVEAKRLKDPPRVVVKAAPPAVIKPIDPPKLTLPARPAGGGDAPRVLGFQGPSGKAAAAIVQMPGESQARLMKPGETLGRWTFVGIEAGNVANFKDGDGRPYAVVIGGGR